MFNAQPTGMVISRRDVREGVVVVVVVYQKANVGMTFQCLPGRLSRRLPFDWF